jgi:hypothetical protein
VDKVKVDRIIIMLYDFACRFGDVFVPLREERSGSDVQGWATGAGG